MIAAFASRVVEAYTAPRASARRMIDAGADIRTIALLIGLAFCLQSGFVALADLLAPDLFPEGRASGVGALARELAILIVIAGVFILGAWWIGRRLGGEAGILDVAVIYAWHSVVTAFWPPILAVSMNSAEAGGIGALALIVILGLTMWLLASYLAEAHKAPSTFRVLGAMLGVMFVAGLLFSGLVASIMGTR